MKESISEHIRQWLPELYGPADAKKKPGGMCSPGQGCGSPDQPSTTDIMRILTGGDRQFSGPKAQPAKNEQPAKEKPSAEKELGAQGS